MVSNYFLMGTRVAFSPGETPATTKPLSPFLSLSEISEVGSEPGSELATSQCQSPPELLSVHHTTSTDTTNLKTARKVSSLPLMVNGSTEYKQQLGEKSRHPWLSCASEQSHYLSYRS